MSDDFDRAEGTNFCLLVFQIVQREKTATQVQPLRISLNISRGTAGYLPQNIGIHPKSQLLITNVPPVSVVLTVKSARQTVHNMNHDEDRS